MIRIFSAVLYLSFQKQNPYLGDIFLQSMKPWLFWAGISFIIGGVISLALNLGVQESLSKWEDLTGYAIGWIAVGVVLFGISFWKGKKDEKP